MNKIPTIIFILFLTTSPLFSCEVTGMGILAGGSFSKFGGAYSGSDFELKTGFQGGLFITCKFTDRYSLQPEVIFTRKGASEKGEEIFTPLHPEGYCWEAVWRLDYIEMCALSKFSISEWNNFRSSFMFGPTFGVIANREMDYSGETSELDIDKTDAGIVFGGSIGYRPFSIDIRCNIGLTDSIENYQYSIYNRTLSVLLGYRF